MSDKFSKIRFSMNAKGKQVKTPQDHVPGTQQKRFKNAQGKVYSTQQEMKSDKMARRNSVPGTMSDEDANMFNPDYKPGEDVNTDEPEDDVDVVIKLSALKKLRNKNSNQGRRRIQDDEMTVQR